MKAVAACAIVASLAASACSGLDQVSQAEDSGADASPTTTLSAPSGITDPSATSPTTAAPTTTSTAPTTSTPSTTAPTTLPPDQRPWPIDATSTAAELSETELAIRDETDPETLAALGRRQQQLYQVLSANRDWADASVAATDPAIRTAVELNWKARIELSALVQSGPLSDTLPAWGVSEPAPASELVGYYHEAAEITGVDWSYLAAINLVETRMGRIVGLSTAGAVGPMQFLPSTWEGCCEGDPNDAHDSIIGAAVYLTRVGAPADMNRALFGYNRSDRYVAAVEAYAQVLRDDERAYAGYHAWEVYFSSSVGILLIGPGYEEHEPVSAASWLADHPEALLGDK